MVGLVGIEAFIEEAREYVLKHIGLKLEKGYQFMPKFVPIPQPKEQVKMYHVNQMPPSDQHLWGIFEIFGIELICIIKSQSRKRKNQRKIK